MSRFTAQYLEKKLYEQLKAQFVRVIDESDGCGSKFSSIVVSEIFKEKSLLQKQRLVNHAIQDELKEIHAFSQRNFTPEQWKEVQQQYQE